MSEAILGLRRGPLLAALAAAFASRATSGATQYDMTVLAPSPFSGGQAYGVYHGKVVGAGFHGAVLWPTPSSFIDLNPPGYASSTAFAIYGNQEAGKAISNTDHQQHAVIWTGTAASLVELSLAPSFVNATDGAQQVGVVAGPNAGLWSGTAASFVNLNPPGYQQSQATGVYGGTQVGFGTSSTGTVQALAWQGTAASFSGL